MSVMQKVAHLSSSQNGNFDDYWKAHAKIEEITNELGCDELKRMAMDALVLQDMNVFQCSGSNLIELRRQVDPLFDIKAAEWGKVYPSSMVEIQFQKWKDEG